MILLLLKADLCRIEVAMTIGERDKIIIDMRNNGHGYADIMQRLGCKKYTVSRAVGLYNQFGWSGIQSKRKLFKDKSKRNEDIMLMHADGMTITEIARKIGMSISAVSRVISKDKPKEPEPEPEIREAVIVHVGDKVTFIRGGEYVIGTVKALNRHTVTITVDHGRYQETCCPSYGEIEAVV